MYNHVALHPSQQVSDPPRVKRNLVRKIVAQFNEEARQRDRLRRQNAENGEIRDTSPYRSSSPPVIEATLESAPNNNKPFSYTSKQPPAFLSRKSKSEHDLKAPNEIIYAQVIVNGHTDKGVPSKTTVHTKVPTRNGYTSNRVDRKSSMNRNQSVSLVNLQGKSAKSGADTKTATSYRKYVADEHYQHYHDSMRAPSPDVSYTTSSIKKQHSKEKRKETDYHRMNGDVSGGSKETNRYIFSDTTLFPTLNKETENLTLLRESRKDKSKRESSLNRQEIKEKTKSLGKEQVSRKASDTTWDKNANKASSREERLVKSKEDVRTSTGHVDTRSRRRLEDDFDSRPYFGTLDDKRGVVYSEESSSRHREDREIDGGHEEIEHKTWSSTFQTVNDNVNDNKGRFELMNGEVDGVGFRGNGVTNFKKTEYAKEEKIVRRHRTSSGSSSPTREDSPSGKARREKTSKTETAGGKKTKQVQSKQKITESTSASKRSNVVHDDTTNYNTTPKAKDNGKKFYYFGANEADINLNLKPRSKEKAKSKHKEKEEAVLSSTRLVKEANAKVTTTSQKEKTHQNSILSSTPITKSPERVITESPIGSGNHDSGYSSRMGMSSPAQNKTISPNHTNERIINIEVEGRKENNIHHQYHHHHHHHHHQNKNLHRHEHVTSAFSEDVEERMETSESDDMANQWGFGSQDSQMSVPSNQWSSLEEEDDENIVAAHVNTPQSIIREMDKREISYENNQRSQDKAYNGQLWFERTEVDSDYRKELSTSGTTVDHTSIRNDNHVNNNWGNSATLSRLETNKNHINNDTSRRSVTLDRRQQQQHNQKRNVNSPSTAVRILLNGRDITDEEDCKDGEGNSINARQSSRTGSYPSETESQHSSKSKGSRKSSGSSPVSKRVNFKTRSKAKRSVSSAANLSPVHREALMRASSPIRPPSANGSLNSSGSEASNKSVILHATAVADIPPAKSYRYRIYRDSSTSPGSNGRRSRENGNRSGKSVTRTFSLLSPWKPKKYKQKYEQRYENSHESQLSANSSADKSELRADRDSHSHNSSSEKLDSLSPLPSEKPKSQETKRVTVVRHNSMPKDTRFTGFFKKKKETHS